MKYEDKKLIKGIVDCVYYTIAITAIVSFVYLVGVGIVKAILFFN